MTDRVDAITVILDHDIRIDDVDAVMSAMRQLRGVLDVRPHISDDLVSRVTVEMRIRAELAEALYAVLYPGHG
jgi:hypothetical protein